MVSAWPGARASDVLQQFLIEAVLVCLVGGALGITLSLLIAFTLQLFLPGWEIGFLRWRCYWRFFVQPLPGFYLAGCLREMRQNWIQWMLWHGSNI